MRALTRLPYRNVEAPEIAKTFTKTVEMSPSLREVNKK
jgi:hypothetical protein